MQSTHCPSLENTLESDLPFKHLGFKVVLIVEVIMLSSLFRNCCVLFQLMSNYGTNIENKNCTFCCCECNRGK